MRKLSGRFLMVVALAYFSLTAACAQSLDALASTAVTWLQRLDAKDSKGAWDAAAPALRDSTKQADFNKALEAKRYTFGAVKGRGLTALQVLPVPADQAAQIAVTFQVAFDKNVTSETAVLQRQANGQWLVSAYFLR